MTNPPPTAPPRPAPSPPAPPRPAPPRPAPPLTVLLAAPRGFCAGVERAVAIVEQTLKQHGEPVYVRHEIVHNAFVVQSLERKGVVFVEELDDIPAHHRTTRPVVFSAHGVAKAVAQEARKHDMHAIDATCPLVSKVHREVERFHKEGYHTLLIGHRNHPEVAGTMGQLDLENAASPPITLIETILDAKTFVPDDRPLALTTQTTLSLDDTKEIVAMLRRRFPAIRSPKKDDICYATANRQNAVKSIAPRCDLMLVLGARNSSNSMRLLEIARNLSPCAVLIRDETDIPPIAESVRTLGITASASAPEELVQKSLAALEKTRTLAIETITLTEESVVFKMPKELTTQLTRNLATERDPALERAS